MKQTCETFSCKKNKIRTVKKLVKYLSSVTFKNTETLNRNL